MKRSLKYGERDYSFGRTMMTLRMTMKLMQTELAELLSISPRAVASWEGGASYPKVEHLKHFIELCMLRQAFSAGLEAEEIRALWIAGHQKVLLDECWLRSLLDSRTLVPPYPAIESAAVADPASSPLAGSVAPMISTAFPRIDWGNALDTSHFYGREAEREQLSQWMIHDRCRVVTLLGMGGIGKSALAVMLMRQLAEHFQVVVWRSMRDAPPCEELLADCLQVLSPYALIGMSSPLDTRIRLLIEAMQQRRCLLVLDNLETLLLEGDSAGHYRSGYEGYGKLVQWVAGMTHQSCLLLTSREKPIELGTLEGRDTPVRSLRLTGLEESAGEQILQEKEVSGSQEARSSLIKAYSGNPLALKIVAETIRELFGGEIAVFLHEGKVIFHGVRALLDQHIARLTALEQATLTWLAIAREPLGLDDLSSALLPNVARMELLEALGALRRRSLIESGKQPATFTLQSVVMEAVTEKVVEQAAHSLQHGGLEVVCRYAFTQARAKEYVRQTQERLLVAPIVNRLRLAAQHEAGLEAHLGHVLDELREHPFEEQGYGPANLIALLRHLRGDLRGINLSRLLIRRANLQEVQMQDANLSGAEVRESVFTDASDAFNSVAVSSNGVYWAMGSGNGNVHIWRDGGQILHLVLQAYTAPVFALTFSPDGAILGSGSWNGTIKLWEVASGALLWMSDEHSSHVESLAFHPDGRTFVSCGADGTLRVWDSAHGTSRHLLQGHEGTIFAVAFSPDGRWLASGGADQTIRLWDVKQATCVQTLVGHSDAVMALAFAPDGKHLVSGGSDKLVKLWEVESGHCEQTLQGHRDTVRAVAWSPDGCTVASGSYDATIRLWRADRVWEQDVLQDHRNWVYAVAFTPDGTTLLSSSQDRTLRVWEVASRQCMRIMHGYFIALLAVAWSPDSSRLVSGSSDASLTLWRTSSGLPERVMQGHSGPVSAVAWSRDGKRIASGSHDHTVRIWDAEADACLHLLQGHANSVTSIAWSPDGKLLASGSSDQTVRIWDMTASTYRWIGRRHTNTVSSVAWSPDGKWLASGSDDSTILLWRAEDGTQGQMLHGHQGDVMGFAWSPDGKQLVSGGGGRGKGGELLLWDVDSGKCLRAFPDLPTLVVTVAWSPHGETLVSGSTDGTIRWWEAESGTCLYVRQSHQRTVLAVRISPNGSTLASCGADGVIQLWDLHSGEHVCTLRSDRPYERLNITGIRGLSQAQKTTLRALGAIEEDASESPC